MSEEQIDGDNKEVVDTNWNITPREVMQFIGTEVFQYKIQEIIPNCNREFWIKSFVNTLQTQKKGNIVVSDLRFLHEYNYMKNNIPTHEILVIRIDNIANNMYDLNDTHISETEYMKIPVDFHINNNMNCDIKSTVERFINNINP